MILSAVGYITSIWNTQNLCFPKMAALLSPLLLLPTAVAQTIHNELAMIQIWGPLLTIINHH